MNQPINKQARQAGMTLLETLVTLVIVAMVAGLLSEGLFQIGRIEQRLGGAQLQAQVERLHAIWVQQALEGLMPGVKDSPERFRGAARELAGLSTQLPEAQALGPQPMRLRLRFSPDAGVTELLLSFGLDGHLSPPQEETVLAQWPGDRGALRYQDPAGAWLAQWPPALDGGAALPPSALPQAIALDRGEGQGLLLVARPAARAEALGQRIDVEKLP